MRLGVGANERIGEAFWRFSLALYARPGVADALVALQNRGAGDVNVMLFGLWLGVSRGSVLTAAELAEAEAAIAPITAAAVIPLRELRRRLKPTADPDLRALRRRIAGLELAAERRVQSRLAASPLGVSRAAPGDGRLAVARGNLALALGDEFASAEAGTICRALAALVRLPP
jgi:uncharacterized protein (TIGR02444 family)